jgi:hypothetical protein
MFITIGSIALDHVTGGSGASYTGTARPPTSTGQNSGIKKAFFDLLDIMPSRDGRSFRTHP